MPEIAPGQLYIGKPLVVFYGNRHVPGSGAYDADAESYRNDLTVTSVLKNSAGSSVGGSAISLDLIPLTKGDRQGIYEGTMSGSISITENSTYYLEITVTDGATTLDFVRIEYEAKYKGA